MRLLLVKMSSMGDLVHTFPAISDALQYVEGLEISWLVEEAFVDIAKAHPGVKTVIPICLRRFLGNPLAHRAEFFSGIKTLRNMQFDRVLDAQGLIKSGIVSRLTGCSIRDGLDSGSAREGLAAYFYTDTHSITRNKHAVDRTRQLFASTLSYSLPEGEAQFGVGEGPETQAATDMPYAVFLHGTSWQNKQWPEHFWKKLAQMCANAGYALKLPSGNVEEFARSKRIGDGLDNCKLLDKVPLAELRHLCAGASFVVSVDTGLGHLAGALGVPVIGLYGPTDENLTGIRGRKSSNLKANFDCAPCMQRRCTYKPGELQSIQPPCFATITPETVWLEIQHSLGIDQTKC